MKESDFEKELLNSGNDIEEDLGNDIEQDLANGTEQDIQKTSVVINSDGIIPGEKYANGSYINDAIWRTLEQVMDGYNEYRKKNELPLFRVLDMRNYMIVCLNGRMNKLADLGNKNSIEYYECGFLRKAFANGWTPSDLKLLSMIFEEVYSDNISPDSEKMGIELLSKIESTPITSVADRYQLLVEIGGFTRSLELFRMKAFESVFNASSLIELRPTEYANDENYAEFYKSNGYLNPVQQTKKGSPVENYLDLISTTTLYQELTIEQKQAVRGKKDYIMARLSDEELEEFDIHEGHKHNKITKSNRQAIKEVFGEEIYDDIDEMHRGPAEERRINIYHSLGNKYLKKGEEVLELDFAGSGFQEARREYAGQHGKAFGDGTVSDKKSIEAQFGELVDKNENKKYAHIRRKKTPAKSDDGKDMEKYRYSIAGPTPDIPLFKGAFNVGEYSIENTRVYGQNFAVQFMNPIFNKWMGKQEEPHDIHIHITGHSRGAVSAGESVKLIRQKAEEYEKSHIGADGFADRVKFKMILRDPVPGLFTSWFHGTNDLRKVPNLDTTLFCSMAQEHTNMAFPLQNVRGAKRIIIGTTEHGMELGSIDTSQMLQEGDGKSHLSGFYDSETGEYFRGSGLTEIPDGVYIADDKYNLIRVTSYSQLGKVIGAVYDGKSQQGRVKNIHKMVRNWFLDNELQMSFVNDEEWEKAAEKNKQVEDKILASDNKRLRDIQRQLKYVRGLKDNNQVTYATIVAENKKLIEECRKYMKKTNIPTSEGDSTYRMNLVSDLISYTMRENNQYAKEMGAPENELDQKIKAHKDRLERKTGALDRKYASEQRRLERDMSILQYMTDTVALCDKTIDVLKNTGKGYWNSTEYKNFLGKLKDGLNLGPKTSVNEFLTYLKDLEEVSAEYEKWHDQGFGPLTDDGKIRNNFSKEFKKYGDEIRKCIESKSKYIGDKNAPINEIIREREQRITSLKDMGAKNPAPEPEKKVVRKNSNTSKTEVNKKGKTETKKKGKTEIKIKK